MKQLTLAVLIIFTAVLTYQHNSPNAIYKRVKHEIESEGYYIPRQISEKIVFTPLPGPIYGMSLDMGAYAYNTVHIGINPIWWKTMNYHHRKILIFHEMLHSIWGIKHCKKKECSMSGGDIKRFTDWNESKEITIKHHLNHDFKIFNFGFGGNSRKQTDLFTPQTIQ